MGKRFLLITVFCLLCYSGLYAAEFREGRIRLDLHEDIGRFSLYYMSDTGMESFLPFFISKDPRSSVLSLMANNQSYRMGDDIVFSTKLGGTSSNPVLVFESSFAVVTEEFTFIRTYSSPVANGVKITITVENKTGQPVNAGVRFLIDTSLGEKEAAHFASDKRQIAGETRIDSSSNDSYWVSGDKNLALMGSILTSDSTRPSFVHFANWKRFNSAGWEFNYVKGRDFNLLPYSIGDSAVCYYFEPEQIPAEGSRTVNIMLAAKDERGFSSSSIVEKNAPPYNFPQRTNQIYDNSVDDYSYDYSKDYSYDYPSDYSSNYPSSNYPSGDYSIRELQPIVLPEEIPPQNEIENEIKQSMASDLGVLQNLMNRLQEYSDSKTITDEELTRMRLLILGIREKYNIP